MANPKGKPAKYSYNHVDMMILAGDLGDGEIADQTGVPRTSVRHRRWEINQIVEARTVKIAAAQRKNIPKKERERIHSATDKYLRLMRENQRACAPIVQALLSQVMMHAVNTDTLLSPSDLNQLANAMATLQKTLRVGMNDIQQSILSLLDYEMVSVGQAEQLFNLLNDSQDDFRKKTRKILGSYDQSKQQAAEAFLAEIEDKATIDADIVDDAD